MRIFDPPGKLVFDRYTDRARRVLFFARCDASELGTPSIDTDLLLLGMLREPKGLIDRLFATLPVSLDDIRKEIEARVGHHEKFPTSVEIPFTGDATRILERAIEEADRLGNEDIGVEHLLLGLLADQSAASAQLARCGMTAEAVRAQIREIQTDPADE